MPKPLLPLSAPLTAPAPTRAIAQQAHIALKAPAAHAALGLEQELARALELALASANHETKAPTTSKRGILPIPVITLTIATTAVQVLRIPRIP